MATAIQAKKRNKHNVDTSRAVDSIQMGIVEIESMLWTSSRALNSMGKETPTPAELLAVQVLTVNAACKATDVRKLIWGKNEKPTGKSGREADDGGPTGERLAGRAEHDLVSASDERGAPDNPERPRFVAG